jgi:hypothetical protein
MRKGTIALDGAPAQRRGFSRWFGLSPFAPVARETLAS